MPKLLGFDVWVEMEGKKLQEYNTETSDNGTEISCWIPCEVGKNFRIGCTLSRELVRTSHHKLSFYLDGRRAYLRHSIFRKKAHRDSDDLRHFEEERVKDGASLSHFQLQFGNLELTDDDACLRDAESLSKLGEIRVIALSAAELVEREGPPSASIYPGPGNHRIHERSKKGLNHCISLGQKQTKYTPRKSFCPVNKKEICTFVFKYRQFDVLMANGIAPVNVPVNCAGPTTRNNEPNPPTRKRGNQDIKEDGGSDADTETVEKTNEEIRKLKAQLAVLENKAKASNAERPSKRVKRETTSTLVPGEVIDLTT